MMQKQVIISISREYGSAGHEIAEKVAEDLKLPLYDRKLLEKVAEEKRVDIAVLEKNDEKQRNVFLSRTVKGFSNSVEEAVAEMQFDFIRKEAQKGESFVVVGRCSEYVLAGHPALVSVFVLGDPEAKLQHVKEKFQLDEAQALAKMKRGDSKRKAYHNYYAKLPWGDSRGYDLCVNSSKLGVEKTAKLIEEFADAKLN